MTDVSKDSGFEIVRNVLLY